MGLAFLFFSQLSSIGFAQSGIISTVAGNGGTVFGDGGLATSGTLCWPSGVVVDAAGNLFIADPGHNRIRKVTASTGIISTVAGGGTQGYGDGISATSAQLGYPVGVAVDAAGNLFIADAGNSRIRKVAGGTISTVAGNGTSGFSGDGGPATSAQLSNPSRVTVDAAGNLIIADTYNNCIRKVTASTGVISTVVGNGTLGFGGDGGPATSAQLNWPSGVVVDTAGNLFIADSNNNVIRKVTTDGVIRTVAGNGNWGYSGDGGPATSAKLADPTGVAVDAAGSLFIADQDNQRIRKVTFAYVPSCYTLSMTTSPPAGGSVTVNTGTNCTGGYTSGTGISLTAVPAANYVFSGWSGTGGSFSNNSAASTTFTITGNASVTANFTCSFFFPQVAVGGGYSTLFTVTNTRSASAPGSLTLTDPQGNPFLVNGTLTDSSGTTQPALPGYSFSFTVPSGGTIFLSATGLTTSSPVTTGWGQLDSAGGSLTAVATYEYVVGGVMQTMVGVLQSQSLQYATIPVDNNTSQSKQTLYAIANPSSQTIAIKLALVGQDGTVVDDTVTLTLLPGQQIAKYLWQTLGRTDFKGSLVLRGQSSATFVAVALVEKQGILTAIPLIAGKAPGVPN
jgi:sugar lactone lactonase YvrE